MNEILLNLNRLEWLFSESAVDRIVLLSRELKTKRLKWIQEKFPQLGLSHSPWFYDDSLTEKPLKSWSNLPKKGLITDAAFLKTLKEDFSNSAGHLRFVEDDSRISAHIDLSENPLKYGLQGLSASLETLFKALPPAKKLENELVEYYVPVRLSMEKRNRFFFSSHLAKGAIFLQCSEALQKENQLTAIDLFHELGHQVLMVYLAADPIVISDPNTLVFSGARKEARPAFRALHSAMALSYMVIAAKALAKWEEAQKHQENLRANVEDLKLKCDFSSFGKVFLGEIDFIAGLS